MLKNSIVTVSFYTFGLAVFYCFFLPGQESSAVDDLNCSSEIVAPADDGGTPGIPFRKLEEKATQHTLKGSSQIHLSNTITHIICLTV
jgi:hypothetical protein